MAAYDEQEYTKSFQLGIWKRLIPLLGNYRRDFALLLIFNLASAVVDVALPLFQRYAIATFIEGDTLRGLLPYALCYLVSSYSRPYSWWPSAATPCTSR